MQTQTIDPTISAPLIDPNAVRVSAIAERKALADFVKFAFPVVSKHSSLRILQCFHVEASAASLTVTACDGENWITATFPAMVTLTGSFCVAAKVLREALTVKTADVEFIQKESGKVKIGPFNCEAMDASDFPLMPEPKLAETTYNRYDLPGRAFDVVESALSADPHRMILTGALIHFEPDNTRIISTDTHRLHVHSRASVNPESRELVLSAVAIAACQRYKHAVTLEVSPDAVFNLAYLSIGTYTLCTTLASGTYPNWERVVPAEATRRFIMDADGLREALNTCKLFAADNANRVRLSFDGIDTLTIHGRSEERGEVSATCHYIHCKGPARVGRDETGNPRINEDGTAIEFADDSFEIAFNCRYLLDGLDALNCTGIVIEATENTRPATLTNADNFGPFVVVMPMQLS